jgi:hypothetical protein
MRMAWTRYVGYTRRNSSINPRRHVHTNRPASQYGRNRLALCGASILPRPLTENGTMVTFDPDHPRACPRCAKEVRHGDM